MSAYTSVNNTNQSGSCGCLETVVQPTECRCPQPDVYTKPDIPVHFVERREPTCPPRNVCDGQDVHVRNHIDPDMNPNCIWPPGCDRCALARQHFQDRQHICRFRMVKDPVRLQLTNLRVGTGGLVNPVNPMNYATIYQLSYHDLNCVPPEC